MAARSSGWLLSWWSRRLPAPLVDRRAFNVAEQLFTNQRMLACRRLLSATEDLTHVEPRRRRPSPVDSRRWAGADRGERAGHHVPRVRANAYVFTPSIAAAGVEPDLLLVDLGPSARRLRVAELRDVGVDLVAMSRERGAEQLSGTNPEVGGGQERRRGSSGCCQPRCTSYRTQLSPSRRANIGASRVAKYSKSRFSASTG